MDTTTNSLASWELAAGQILTSPQSSHSRGVGFIITSDDGPLTGLLRPDGGRISGDGFTMGTDRWMLPPAVAVEEAQGYSRGND